MNMRFFDHNHLPEDLKQVSAIISEAAFKIDKVLPFCEEKEEGMRKLLEGKDCFVRAALENRVDVIS
jgi:hypothetical protein